MSAWLNYYLLFTGPSINCAEMQTKPTNFQNGNDLSNIYNLVNASDKTCSLQKRGKNKKNYHDSQNPI